MRPLGIRFHDWPLAHYLYFPFSRVFMQKTQKRPHHNFWGALLSALDTLFVSKNPGVQVQAFADLVKFALTLFT
jgi:hypothetical protein